MHQCSTSCYKTITACLWFAQMPSIKALTTAGDAGVVNARKEHICYWKLIQLLVLITKHFIAVIACHCKRIIAKIASCSTVKFFEWHMCWRISVHDFWIHSWIQVCQLNTIRGTLHCQNCVRATIHTCLTSCLLPFHIASNPSYRMNSAKNAHTVRVQISTRHSNWCRRC